MSDSNQDNLLLFFDRPMEPCFNPKGDDQKELDVPHVYYPEKYEPLKTSLGPRSGDASRLVHVNDIGLPLAELSVPRALPYNAQFSLFVPEHRTMAGKLIDIFMGMRSVEDLMSVCSYCQLHINPYMFNYCLSVTILHKKFDDKRLKLEFPTIAELFPDKFVHPKIFHQARELTTMMAKIPEEERKPMPLLLPHNYTASEKEPEQRVAYFREDIGINLHHWHWHLVYPFDGPRDIVNKDRRGELFYYMHQQIIARYNVERLCNDLELVKPYKDFQEPIKEGYFPKLDSQVASRAWPPRFANTKISDLDRPADNIKIEIRQLEIWRDRFKEAIDSKTVKLPDKDNTYNQTMPLDDTKGIDVLGNMMEASILSPNPGYYGNLHNMGHNFLAYAHDPDYRHLEFPGVMGESSTAMRDPVFYRWHAHIDELFFKYKYSLDPYSYDQLNFPDIRVSSIEVQGSADANRFATQWEQSPMELKRGLDFTHRLQSVQAVFTHLQHEEFEYVIQVNNESGRAKTGMFRIFMAPKEGENGNPLRFEEQRRLMIELDKFSWELRPGDNTIPRRSVDSSVTIPYERTFRDQKQRLGDPGSAAVAEFDFCGCGWPHHMLIPKGTEIGYPMKLFCMVSNYANDEVKQDLGGSCNDAASYCGIRDKKYPDKRAMGYPFDRRARSGVNNLDNFLTPNMAAQDCTIKFSNATRQRAQMQ